MQRGQEWVQELNQLEAGTGEFEFLDFANFDVGEHQQQSAQQHVQSTGLDISSPMGRLTFGQNGQMQVLTPQQHAMLHNLDMNMAVNLQTNMDFSAGQQQSQQVTDGQAGHFQQYSMYADVQNPYRNQVPPTPVSAEMHAAKYGSALDNAGQMLFERQNASFTPLSSPAIENPWGMPDYVIAADDFFSPLTSPMLDAQLDAAYSTHTTSSPVDLNTETQQTTSKPRRKLNPTSRVASTRSLRGSPIVRANTRRKQGSVSGHVADQLAPNVEHSTLLLPGAMTSTVGSSEDSVSPEPLSESLMRPPPIPQASRGGVYHRQSKDDNLPATPATLMRISGKQTNPIPGVSGSGTPSLEAPMQDITLPAAAADIPQHVPLHPLDTRVADDMDDSSTPTMTAKTPKLSADSTPRSTGVRNLTGSQELLPKPSRGGRGSKKRQSVSLAAVSPALRPKISPNISPMVTTGTTMPILSAETSALYLASKSNYQNILDGTHLASYPETLAENLSSKRTSHKIAEQGRRNRINIALKEIESLLPASITAAAARKEKAAKDEAGDDKPSSSQGTSKASTVEMAIVYIKSLQAELKSTQDRLEAVEKSLAEGNSSGSQASGDTNA